MRGNRVTGQHSKTSISPEAASLQPQMYPAPRLSIPSELELDFLSNEPSASSPKLPQASEPSFKQSVNHLSTIFKTRPPANLPFSNRQSQSVDFSPFPQPPPQLGIPDFQSRKKDRAASSTNQRNPIDPYARNTPNHRQPKKVKKEGAHKSSHDPHPHIPPAESPLTKPIPLRSVSTSLYIPILLSLLPLSPPLSVQPPKNLQKPPTSSLDPVIYIYICSYSYSYEYRTQTP